MKGQAVLPWHCNPYVNLQASFRPRCRRAYVKCPTKMPRIDAAGDASVEQDQTLLQLQMMDIIAGNLKPIAAFLMARLGVADNLKASDGHAKSARQLAEELKVDADMLYRCLRWAVVVGLLKEEHLMEVKSQSVLDSRGFVITPLGQLLEEDHPKSMKAAVVLTHSPLQARPCEGQHLLKAIKQGIPGMVPAFGEGSEFFPMMLKDPEHRVYFEKTMSWHSNAYTDLVLSYNFGAHKKLVDIGGNRGTLMKAILTKYPTLEQGISFDLPEVTTPCKEMGVPTELAGRMEFVGGSFFENLPKELGGADCMTVKQVLHDWNDSQCIDILRHCAASLAPGGKLVIIEHVLPETLGMDVATASLAPFGLDMVMMGCLTGKERTLYQWTELFKAAGLTEPKVAASSAPMACMVTSVA